MTSKKKPGFRFRRTRKGKGLPRVMWVAIAVCIIGAVLIFRDQGGEVPTGIGEYKTVVTAPEEEQNLPSENGPRSGDVDIADKTITVTPEEPEGGSSSKPEEKAAEKPAVKQAATVNPTPKPVAPKQTTPPPARITPASSGPYLVQTGSFGDSTNADKEATRLQGLGFDARVKMGNTSDNSLIYRVRIGYFKSRTEAEAFIRQNRKAMPGAIPAHR